MFHPQAISDSFSPYWPPCRRLGARHHNRACAGWLARCPELCRDPDQVQGRELDLCPELRDRHLVFRRGSDCRLQDSCPEHWVSGA